MNTRTLEAPKLARHFRTWMDLSGPCQTVASPNTAGKISPREYIVWRRWVTETCLGNTQTDYVHVYFECSVAAALPSKNGFSVSSLDGASTTTQCYILQTATNLLQEGGCNATTSDATLGSHLGIPSRRPRRTDEESRCNAVTNGETP
jgi:hypothetical protein